MGEREGRPRGAAPTASPVRASEPLPLVAFNPGLPQEARQKLSSNVCLVRIGDAQSAFAPDHELVFAAREWALEAGRTKRAQQLGAADRAKCRHAAMPPPVS
jgi:hypothetical protein